MNLRYIAVKSGRWKQGPDFFCLWIEYPGGYRSVRTPLTGPEPVSFDVRNIRCLSEKVLMPGCRLHCVMGICTVCMVNVECYNGKIRKIISAF